MKFKEETVELLNVEKQDMKFKEETVKLLNVDKQNTKLKEEIFQRIFVTAFKYLTSELRKRRVV